MKNLVRILRTRPLLIRLIIYLLVLIGIPFILFQYLLFHSWLNTSDRLALEQYEIIFKDKLGELKEDFITIEKLNDLIYTQPNINEISSKLIRNYEIDELRNDTVLYSMFESLSFSILRSVSIDMLFTFFSMDGELIYQSSNTPKWVRHSNFEGNYSKEKWFTLISENGATNTLVADHQNFLEKQNKEQLISFGQVIRNKNNLQDIGISILTVPINIFNKLVDSSRQNYVVINVTDADGKSLYSNISTEGVPLELERELFGGITPYGWEIQAGISQKQLSRHYIVPLIRNNLLFICFAFILLGIFIFVLSHLLTPLYRLANEMRKAKNGNFKEQIHSLPPGEFGMLTRVFNEMIAEIDTLFKKQEQDYKEKLQFQMITFEVQLNPHFVYNTLDLIQNHVFESNPEIASGLIVSLSKNLRYVTKHPGVKVTCQEEISWLNEYIFLQKELHGGLVEVSIHIDAALLTHKIPKLYFQPIIENAFIHAFAKKTKHYHLEITGKIKEKEISFEIVDNGEGFPEEVQLQLVHSNQKQILLFGNGLSVTIKRLLLMSDGNQFSLFSKPGHGTRVTLRERIVR